MPDMKRIIVIVTDEAKKDIESVADELVAAGMTIADSGVKKITGAIIGSCPEEKKSALRAVKGVHSVEDEGQSTIAQ